MLARPRSLFIGAAIVAVCAACGAEDDPPTSTAHPGNTPPPTNNNGVGGTDVAEGPCDSGELRGCKVYINEDNCFVGEQMCIDGEWSPCQDPGSFDNADGAGGSGGAGTG